MQPSGRQPLSQARLPLKLPSFHIRQRAHVDPRTYVRVEKVFIQILEAEAANWPALLIVHSDDP